jgi:hypothetical protein
MARDNQAKALKRQQSTSPKGTRVLTKNHASLVGRGRPASPEGTPDPGLSEARANARNLYRQSVNDITL